MKLYSFGLTFLLLYLGFFAIEAQTNALVWEKGDFQIMPDVALQLWTTYTWGHQLLDGQNNVYQLVDNRWNLQLRRGRLGVKGRFNSRLRYRLTAGIDGVGHDLHAATYGPVNNGANPLLRLWFGFVRWQILESSDALHLTAGYFSPRFSREHITSPFNSPSLEKAWSQNYVRRHLTGYGHGRAVSLGLGGQFYEEARLINLKYDLGISNPQPPDVTGLLNTSKVALLYTGRVSIFFGAIESPRYGLDHKVNYFGARKGATLGLSGAWQGEEDLFASNSAFAIDWLFNGSNFHLDGDFSILARKDGVTSEKVFAYTGYFRLGYNIKMGNIRILEPVVLLTYFQGESELEMQESALRIGLDSGAEHLLDLGLNLHFDPRLRLMLHINLLNGELEAEEAGRRINNYFRKSSAIKRGNWFGLGFVVVL